MILQIKAQLRNKYMSSEEKPALRARKYNMRQTVATARITINPHQRTVMKENSNNMGFIPISIALFLLLCPSSFYQNPAGMPHNRKL